MKGKTILISVLFILFFCYGMSIGVYAQGDVKSVKGKRSKPVKALVFQKINQDNGLSSNACHAVIVDRMGFIWIGTEDGLNRYNGIDIKTFEAGPEGGAFISAPLVNALLEDSRGLIWIGTEGGGLNCYDPVTERIIFFYHDPANDNSLSGNKVNTLCEDKAGRLWVGTSNGLDCVEVSVKQGESSGNKSIHCNFTHYRNDPNKSETLRNNRILSLYIDHNNYLWVGTVELGVYKLDISSMDEDPVQLCWNVVSGDSMGLCSNTVNSIMEDILGNIWIGTNQGIDILSYNSSGRIVNIVHYENDPENSASLSNNDIYSLCSDTEGNIWIGTIGGGINFVSYNQIVSGIEHLAFVRYMHNNLDPESIFANAINSITYMDDGTILFATNNKGVGRILNASKIFSGLRHNPVNVNSLPNNVVKTISEDEKGNIWIGTWGGGLSKYIAETNQFINYTYDHNRPSSISSNTVQTIAIDKYGKIWIGTVGEGLNYFDPARNRFIHFKHFPDSSSSLINNDIWSLCLSKDEKTLWIGTYMGLDKMDLRNYTFKHYKHDPSDLNSLSFEDIRALYEDDDHYLWIGTNGGGLERLDKRTDKFTHYRSTGTPFSLSNNSVYTIYEDRQGNLWIGTLGGGLNLLSVEEKLKKEPIFKHYQKSDGLANNVVKGIIEDDAGVLWISTSNGLSRFNPHTETFINYNENNGLLSSVFNLNAACKTGNGRIYFGSVNGLIFFNTEKIKKPEIHPRIIVSEIKVNGHSLHAGEKLGKKVFLDRSVMFMSEIRLPYHYNSLSLKINVLPILTTGAYHLSYMLENLDTRWHNVELRNQDINYPNLKPGTYVIQARVKYGNTINDPPKELLTIRIVPPFWRSRMALVLYGILSVIAYLYARKLTFMRLKLKEEIERERAEQKRNIELNQMKLRFFTNVSHEFRTPLTLIYAPVQKLLESKIIPKEHKNEFRIIEKNVERLHRLINQLLDFSKIDKGGLRLEVSKDDILKEVKNVMDMFSVLARQNKINYRLITSKKKIICLYDRDKLEKILYNLLSNAFKNTLAGDEITVRIKTCFTEKEKSLQEILGDNEITTGKFVCITVSDTGVGIPEKEISKIFDRFYKVEDPVQINSGGTGIGLSFVKSLVEMHHGKILVKSKKNKGTCFYIYLPGEKIHYTEEEIVQTSFVVNPGLRYKETGGKEVRDGLSGEVAVSKGYIIPDFDKTVLIVEDDADVLNYLKENIGEYFTIEVACNGKEALKLIYRTPPNIVISDIVMPVLDGIELCRKLKTDVRTNHIPVVLLTSKTFLEHRLQGLKIGADAYITKPFHLGHLIIQIQNILKQRERIREKLVQEISLKPKDVEVKTIDQQYLEKAVRIIEEHMEDDAFSVEKFAGEMFESRVQLYRRLRTLSGMSPSEFITTIRIKRAAYFLENEGSNVSEVMYKVGFNNRSYFNRCFKKLFNQTPSEYKKQHYKTFVVNISS